MKAHRQGSSDELCGIYAVLNSTKLVIQPARCRPHLFKKCMAALIQKRGSADFIWNGTNLSDLTYLLKNVVCREYPIHRLKPFHKKANVSLDEYWNRLVDFLEEPNRSVIILFHSYYLDHWSVVKEATDSRLILFDSYGTRALQKKYCTVSELSDTKTKQLFPTMTYFLQKRTSRANTRHQIYQQLK